MNKLYRIYEIIKRGIVELIRLYFRFTVRLNENFDTDATIDTYSPNTLSYDLTSSFDINSNINNYSPYLLEPIISFNDASNIVVNRYEPTDIPFYISFHPNLPFIIASLTPSLIASDINISDVSDIDLRNYSALIYSYNVNFKDASSFIGYSYSPNYLEFNISNNPTEIILTGHTYSPITYSFTIDASSRLEFTLQSLDMRRRTSFILYAEDTDIEISAYSYNGYVLDIDEFDLGVIRFDSSAFSNNSSDLEFELDASSLVDLDSVPLNNYEAYLFTISNFNDEETCIYINTRTKRLAKLNDYDGSSFTLTRMSLSTLENLCYI